MFDNNEDGTLGRLLVVAFYKFVKLDGLASLQREIESWCRSNDVFGIVLLASEGINSTIAGSREGVMRVLKRIRQDTRFSEIQWKESFATEQPFHKLRVRLKKEIVTMGVPEIDPNQLVGTYVKPADWNALIVTQMSSLLMPATVMKQRSVHSKVPWNRGWTHFVSFRHGLKKRSMLIGIHGWRCSVPAESVVKNQRHF